MTKSITHRYRIRIGRRLWIQEVKFNKRGKLVHLALTEDRRLSIVFESDMPKWATSKFDQKLRSELSEQPFNMSWSNIHFVEA